MTTAPSQAALRVLVVEDDDVDFLVLRRLFAAISEVEVQIERAADYHTALAAVQRRAHDLYLFDYYLAGHTAVDLMREVTRGEPSGPVIVLTGADARDADLSAMAAGAADYLVKGQIGPRQLERSIRYAVERFRLLRETQVLSLRDELTGLYNRRAFVTLANQQLRQAARQGFEVSLLFADIDGLKAINDEHGHQEGDRAIVAVATVLRQAFRDSDVVARLGGDEFVVLVTGPAPSSVDHALARVRARFVELNSRGSLRAPIGVSFGRATANGALGTIEALLEEADQGLYAEKRARSLARVMTPVGSGTRRTRRARAPRRRPEKIPPG
jgi:diguanylate cyclase (GGDEF)-like protein